jgi:hypothetical protein
MQLWIETNLQVFPKFNYYVSGPYNNDKIYGLICYTLSKTITRVLIELIIPCPFANPAYLYFAKMANLSYIFYFIFFPNYPEFLGM